MFGALKRGRFRSLASLFYTCSECCWRTSTEKYTCGIVRFPCGSTAFLYIIMFVVFIVIFKGCDGFSTLQVGKAYATVFCLSVVCRRLWRYVLWLNGAS